MSDFHGLSLLIDKVVSEHEKTKKSLSFTTKWIDQKYRDGHKITARDYQEFLNELSKRGKEAEAMKEPKEILIICVCGEVAMSDDGQDLKTRVCRTCQRHGRFNLVCEDCRGTEDLNGQPCHCVHD